ASCSPSRVRCAMSPRTVSSAPPPIQITTKRRWIVRKTVDQLDDARKTIATTSATAPISSVGSSEAGLVRAEASEVVSKLAIVAKNVITVRDGGARERVRDRDQARLPAGR